MSNTRALVTLLFFLLIYIAVAVWSKEPAIPVDSIMPVTAERVHPTDPAYQLLILGPSGKVVPIGTIRLPHDLERPFESGAITLILVKPN